MSGAALPGSGADGPPVDRFVARVRPRLAPVLSLLGRAEPLLRGLSWILVGVLLVGLVASPPFRASLARAVAPAWLLVQLLLVLSTRSLGWRTVVRVALAGAVLGLVGVLAALLVAGTPGWAQALWSTLWDHLLPLLALLAFLRGTVRARSAGLADVALVGAAAGAGYQAVRDLLLPLGPPPTVLALLPGGFASGGRVYGGIALLTALVAVAAAFPRRWGVSGAVWPAHLPRPLPLLMMVLGVVDRLVWEGRAALPAWAERAHDAIGGGALAPPLLAALLVGAVALDVRELHRRAEGLPRLGAGEGPLGDALPALRVTAPRGVRALLDLLTFVRLRRRLAYGLDAPPTRRDPALAGLPARLELLRDSLGEEPDPRPPTALPYPWELAAHLLRTPADRLLRRTRAPQETDAT